MKIFSVLCFAVSFGIAGKIRDLYCWQGGVAFFIMFLGGATLLFPEFFQKFRY